MNRSLLLSLTFGLVLLGMTLLNGAIVALALPLLVLLGAGLFDAPAEPHLSVTRSITPDRASQGQPIEVFLRITNTGASLAEISLRDRLPHGLTLLDGQPECTTILPAGASTELRYTIQGSRGLYSFEHIQATLADRLGIFPHRFPIPAPGQVFVLPELMRLRQIAVRPRRTRIYAGQIPARQGGSGIDFFGVRPYQPGDSARRLNTRLSARHQNELFVNEFEQERVADIGIILDARARSDVRGEHGSLFEHGVEAAAALADSLLTQGNRVGLLVYGNAIEWTFPGYGKIQREKVLRALASAHPGDRLALETFDNIPTRLFPTRSLLILISTLTSDDTQPLVGLRARGYQLVVISPDPVDYECTLLGLAPDAPGPRAATIERALLLQRLRQTGIPVVNWPVKTPFALIAAQALSRRTY